MFKSTFSKLSSSESEDFLLFVNPKNSKKTAKLTFLTLEDNKSENSNWEFYMNPTIVSNGTLIPTTKLDRLHPDTNFIKLYTGPTIVFYPIPFRKFSLPANNQETSTNIPTEQLEPGESILLKRTSKIKGKITATWLWEESDS